LAAAESLAGLVMHQTQHHGAPFIFGACVSQLDMRTMLFPYGSSEWRLNDLVMAELSRYYGLPVFGTGGATDSKLADAQAGADYATSLLVAALAGTNLIHDARPRIRPQLLASHQPRAIDDSVGTILRQLRHMV
jgi:trimethylamine--corrinoid protein Co-methyltransferase